MSDYYSLDPVFSDPKRLKKEREKARKLRKSQWWLTLLNKGLCHYCGKKFAPAELTMDHVVPLARGGESNPGNIVPACHDCNREKKLDTPVDQLLRQVAEEGGSPHDPDAGPEGGCERDEGKGGGD